jgi:hypothetical protein
LLQNPTDAPNPFELVPARRNRYYYGKLMDVLHFSMEQQYGRAKHELLNRAVLGAGVVCGLDVQPDATGKGLIVRSGLAIDGWGREIIVPQDVQLTPLSLTNPTAQPVPNTGQPLPQYVTVQICYHECQTDFGPALVGDTGCGDSGCEAGTWVESYCIKVVSGTAPPVPPFAVDVLTELKAGNLQAAMCKLSQPYSSAPLDPCLTLANVTVVSVPPGGPDHWNLTVDTCTPRQIVPTNLMLAQLVSNLARCCAQTTGLLQVTDVTVYQSNGPPGQVGTTFQLLGQLKPNADPLKPNIVEVPQGARPNVIEVTFNEVPYDRTSVTNDTVTISQENVPLQDIRIIPNPAGNALWIYDTLRRPPTALTVTLYGDPNPLAQSSPTFISAQGGTKLDGEFPSSAAAPWHSGNGAEGGSFIFQIGFQQASTSTTGPPAAGGTE